MRKGDGLRGKSDAFAPCLLQFKRLGRFMKRYRKSMPNGHPKSTQIDALGTLGVDFCDFYGFWQGLFFYVFRLAKRLLKFKKNDLLDGLGCQGLGFYFLRQALLKKAQILS